MPKERLLEPTPTNEERESESSLRPLTLNEYVGQSEMKHNLSVFLGAAKKRGEALDHVLLYGPPGLGKTTMAFVIANEMGGHIRIVNGPSIEKTGDLAAILSEIEPGDVLFIDEIHRLPRVVEEVLYGAMEDFTLSIMVSNGGTSHAISLPLAPFTLVGATTRAGDLSSPLRARFGISLKIDYYSEAELEQIVKRTSGVFKTPIEDMAAMEIARRSRGTPRLANRLFRRIRDFATFYEKDRIDIEVCQKALNALKIDELGLDEIDIRYLTTLIERFHGGPVGLEPIATAIGEEMGNLEDVYEPYLVMIGMVNRTPRGRVATERAYKHLKKSYQNTLF